MFFKEEKKITIPNPVNIPELFHSKVALITNGSGIGLAMVESFIKSGAVIIAGTNEEKLRSWCEKYPFGNE